MCRVLIVLNQHRRDRPVMKRICLELEKSQGGDGNGVFNISSKMNKHSFWVNRLYPWMYHNYLFHTRIKSHGKVNLDNCHPYWLKNTITNRTIVGMQNGSAMSYTPTPPDDKSDTYHLVTKICNESLSFKEVWDLSWYGILVLYYPDTNELFMFVKKEFYIAVTNKGTILYASEITKSMEKIIMFNEKLENGVYKIIPTTFSLELVYKEPEKTYTYTYGYYDFCNGSYTYHTPSRSQKKKMPITPTTTDGGDFPFTPHGLYGVYLEIKKDLDDLHVKYKKIIGCESTWGMFTEIVEHIDHHMELVPFRTGPLSWFCYEVFKQYNLDIYTDSFDSPEEIELNIRDDWDDCEFKCFGRFCNTDCPLYDLAEKIISEIKGEEDVLCGE